MFGWLGLLFLVVFGGALVFSDNPAGYIGLAEGKTADIALTAVAVVSADAVKSDWVKTELRYARELARQRDGFRVMVGRQDLPIAGREDRAVRADVRKRDELGAGAWCAGLAKHYIPGCRLKP